MARTKHLQAKNAQALLIFAHGAGADMNSSFMETMSEYLLEQNISTLRFNFPYMDRRIDEEKRFPPDRMPKLCQCIEQLVSEIKTDLPIFVCGKSMGSRALATYLQSLEENVLIQGYIALGYPFHPQNKPEKTRLEPLQHIVVPSLIIQGDRDKLGNREEIASYDIDKRIQFLFLPDGDHDLKPRVRSGFTHEQHLKRACRDIKDFINKNV